MAMQFPGSIPPARQNPYPNEPMYGNAYQDIGKGLRQTGGDVSQFGQEMDQANARQQALADMVQRRVQVQAVQQAREEWKQADMEFKEAQALQTQANREDMATDRDATSKATAEYRTEKSELAEAERKRAHEFRLARLKQDGVNRDSKSASKEKAKLSRNYPQYVKRELDRILGGTPKEEVMTRMQDESKSLQKNINMAEQIVSGEVPTTSGDVSVYEDTLKKSKKTLGRIQEVIDAIALEMPDEDMGMSMQPEQSMEDTLEWLNDPQNELDDPKLFDSIREKAMRKGFL